MTGSAFIALPYFLASIFVFYWSLPLAATIYRIRFATFNGLRNDMHDWAKAMVRFFGVKILRHGVNTLYKDGSCIYLCNHRSWADFFLDCYLTEGQAALMSRWMVFFAFPIFMSSVYILRGVVLFKRGVIRDKEKFNNWLDFKRSTSIVPSMLVYPEGTRSMARNSLALKRGMLHYAYSRKLPVQVIISRNKELVLSEKTKQAHFGVTVVSGFSDVIHTKDFPDFDAFFVYLQRVWDDMWRDVYGTNTSELQPLVQESVPLYDYPHDMRLQQFLITSFSIVVLALVLYTSWAVTAFMTGLLGPVVQKVLIAVLASIMAYSFVHGIAEDSNQVTPKEPPPHAAPSERS